MFSVPVSVTETWRFPALGFCFLLPHFAGYRFGLFECLDALPFMGRLCATTVEVGEPKLVWRAKLSISSDALFGDLEKAQCNAFTDGRTDGVSMDAVLYEIIVGDRQLAVIVPTVMPEFYFDTRQNAVTGKTKYPICGQFQHANGAGRELLADLVAATDASPSSLSIW